MFIPDPTFFHPGSRIRGSKRHWNPDPGSGAATLMKNNVIIMVFKFSYRDARFF
jgi:hypothetical protein